MTDLRPPTAPTPSGWPTLSVIVPNYNHGRHLPACLDALLAQSVPATEIVLIDDGSTDHSPEVMAAYAQRHPQIQVHRNDQNRGVVYTMNRGIELARGDYVHLAGADDEVMSGLFEKSLRLLTEHPRAALSCTISRWNDASTGVQWLMGAGMTDRPAFLSPDDLVALERRGRLMIVSHSAIVRRSVVLEFGGFLPDLRWHCDWFLTYAGAFRHGLCHIPETLSEVHLHGTSYYGAGHQKAAHAEVMKRLLELLHEERYLDVGARVRDSGALALHSTPMLRAMLQHPGYRDFLTARFIRKALWRRVQILARRHFPPWLARWCVRVFLGQRS
jgi:glycosyltransferase involved in cell wall biosynthesis